MEKVNIFKHPVNVIVVDDDKFFLESMKMLFDGLPNKFQYFNDPIKALNYINSNKCIDINEFSDFRNIYEDDTFLDIDFEKMYCKVLEKNKYDEIGIVIVDYDMVGKNGIEFLECITNPNIYKVLLTGVANEMIAVEAFNKGILNRYIKKQQSYLFKTLLDVISIGENQIFQKMTENFFATYKEINNSLINNDNYKKLFNDVIINNSITEYYALDSKGSYLMTNNKGDECYFIIVSDINENNFDDIVSETYSYIKMITSHINIKFKNSYSHSIMSITDKYKAILITDNLS